MYHPEEGEASHSKWEKNMAGLLRSAAPDKAHITFGVELAPSIEVVLKHGGLLISPGLHASARMHSGDSE